MSRILLALDHTAVAGEATRTAIDQARADAAELVIVGLTGPTMDVQPGAGERIRRYRDVRTALVAAAHRAAVAGVSAQVLAENVFVNGDREERLRDLASEVGAGEIVHVQRGGLFARRGKVGRMAVAVQEDVAERELLAA